MAAIEAKLKKFTFPVSGKTIYTPAFSAGMMNFKLQRKYKRPMPPEQEVDYGDGHKRREYNYSHPGYQLDLANWQRFLNEEATAQVLKRVFYNIELNAEQTAEVAAWKVDHEGWYDDSDPDAALWIEEIAIQDDADAIALMEFIQQGGDAAEEGIDAATDGF